MSATHEITIDGVAYNIGHLQPFTVTLSGKGKDNSDLRVKVTLGLHTISKGCSAGHGDMNDENGKPRIFCPDRYSFSLNLPALISTMIETNYFAWESSDKNMVSNYAVIGVPPQSVHKLTDGEYQVVFFYLHPADDSAADVIFTVTSCHSRQIVFRHIKRRYSIHSLLRTCLYNQKRIP